MRVSELVRVMRGYGLTVVEVAGCYGRGNDFPERPDGALRHWTAGGPGGKPSLGVVTHGRGGTNPLPGPLSQTLQSREVDANGLDVVYFVADGKANHAGTGVWNGISGNYKLLGNEIEWSGPSEAFGPKRVLTSELIARAMLDVCSGTNDNDVAEHREYATPAGRKIDTNLDGNTLRRRMTELRTQPTPTPGDDGEMSQLVWYKGATGPHCYYNVGMINKHCTTMETVNLLKYLGVKETNTASTPLTGAWLDCAVFADGPLRNTPKDVNVAAIADAVAAKFPPSSGGGVTEAQVKAACVAAISEQLGFLKPGV